MNDFLEATHWTLLVVSVSSSPASHRSEIKTLLIVYYNACDAHVLSEIITGRWPFWNCQSMRAQLGYISKLSPFQCVTGLQLFKPILFIYLFIFGPKVLGTLFNHLILEWKILCCACFVFQHRFFIRCSIKKVTLYYNWKICLIYNIHKVITKVGI